MRPLIKQFRQVLSRRDCIIRKKREIKICIHIFHTMSSLQVKSQQEILVVLRYIDNLPTSNKGVRNAVEEFCSIQHLFNHSLVSVAAESLSSTGKHCSYFPITTRRPVLGPYSEVRAQYYYYYQVLLVLNRGDVEINQIDPKMCKEI